MAAGEPGRMAKPLPELSPAQLRRSHTVQTPGAHCRSIAREPALQVDQGRFYVLLECRHGDSSQGGRDQVTCSDMTFPHVWPSCAVPLLCFPECREGHWNKVRIGDTNSVESQLDLMLNFERYPRLFPFIVSLRALRPKLLQTGADCADFVSQAGVDQQFPVGLK